MQASQRLTLAGFIVATVIGVLLPLSARVAKAQLLPFHHLSARDGLVSNNITSFGQDGRGRLWIGTEGGLSVFDGITFHSYSVDDGMPSGFINGIARDPMRTGAIWAATPRGLIGADDHGIRVVQDSAVEATWITDVTTSPRGTVWVATGSGLRVLRHDSLQKRYLPPGVGTVSKMTVTPDGMLWLLSNRGVFRYEPRSGRCVAIDSTIGSYRGANMIAHDSRGDVLACTRDSSILHFRDGAFHARYDFGHAQPYSLTADNHGAFWVVCDSGLYHFPSGRIDPSRAIRYTQKNGLPVSSMHVVFFDSERNLWFGTGGRGISRLEDWHTLMFRDMTVTGLGSLDHRGHLWLTAEDGFWEFWEDGPRNWRRILHQPARSWPKLWPFRSAIGPDGALWGSFRSGIARFTIDAAHGGPSRLRPDGLFAGGDIFSIPDPFSFCVDVKGRLWCNVGGGNVLAVEGRPPFRLLRHYSGLPIDIRTIYEDRQGRIWIGGYGTGVRVIDGNDLSREPWAVKELDGASVRDFLMDHQGRMWIGTLPYGLAVLEGGAMRRFTKSNGLLSNSIYSFAEAPDHTVWMGTHAGMAYATEGSYLFRWTQELTDSPVWDCGVRDDGVLWVATRYGLTIFDVPQSTREMPPPRVAITGLYVNGQPVPVQDAVDLGSTNRNCRVEFSTVRLRRARDIRYQYMLAGIDSSWSPPSAERSVTLAGLRPGNYTLLIRAISGDQTEGSVPVRLQIAVSRPFWQTWWFILLVIASIGIVLTLVIRGRVRRLLEIERIRSRIAADLHDDIGSGLTRIALMTEVMQRQIMGLKDSDHRGLITDLRGAMDRVGSISRELVDSMGDVVWSIDPRNDTLARLIDRITVFTNDLCESRDISAHISAPDEIRSQHTNSDLSRAVLLLCKEAVNNAARHSGASDLRISFSLDGSQLRLRIADDGCGFDEALLSRINGLVNMRNRIEKAGGRIVIESAPGKGTQIDAVMPMHE